jgi:NADPH:quinone reductase-like Zn-dependent oxidoreductase
MTNARAVRFDEYGDRDVLYVADVPMPSPAEGEVLLEVRAAGINPGEAAIRGGRMGADPSRLPSGQGSDVAGVVIALGEGVTSFAVGDEVLGYSWTRSSQATHAAVPVTQLITKPSELSWEQAGGLYVAGCTAWATVETVDPKPGETVVVSAAAGGVGSLVVQLLRERGAKVVGIASAGNAAWLRGHGVTPVEYGDDLAARVLAVAPDGVDGFIDLFGPQYVDLAIELGVDPQRIDTIISFDAAKEHGTHAIGSTDYSSREVLHEVAGRIASGDLELVIAKTYPLDEVVAAFADLEQRHTRGKIVLIP